MNEEIINENEAYLRSQLITYIGNKRALLDFIGKGLEIVQRKTGRQRLSISDVFSGSGAAARYFKRHAELLIVNDLEKYSSLINKCYLSNRNEIDLPLLKKEYDEIKTQLAENNLREGMIAELYAPADEDNIRPDDRVFYTRRNAMYIDTARQIIDALPNVDQKFFLGPLLSEASIHANTSGVFKGFYKNRETGRGQYGGKNKDSLFRIRGDIDLPFPVFSNFSSELMIFNEDSNELVRRLPEVDVAYLDPPYNQHPYGSNYFMLNLILDYRRPEKLSRVSGIPVDWKRSDYNKKDRALKAFADLTENIKAKYILISFNSDGFIGLEEMKPLLERIGRIEILETKYNTFRGSRNLRGRDIHIKEYLYLVEKR